jgi:hypothetical protein
LIGSVVVSDVALGVLFLFARSCCLANDDAPKRLPRVELKVSVQHLSDTPFSLLGNEHTIDN